MNAPESIPRESFASLLERARQPFPASRKVYVPGQLHADLRVPVRDIALTNGEQVSVYDTSGPYTDPNAVIDVRRGLASVRDGWIEARGDTESYAGRNRVALDDGQKSDDAVRLAALRAEAAALQRQPRRAQSGANVTSRCITPGAASSRQRWNTSRSARTASASGWSSTSRTPPASTA